MFCYCEFSLLLEELEKWPRRYEVPLGLDYWRISLPTRAYFGIHDHALRISVVGWSGCGLGINGKRAGAGTNAVKNSGYFLACNVAVMLKIETRPGCTRTKSCDASRETKKNKKVTSKQEQRLNFRVNVDFWFCNDDFCKKPEGNKTWSLSFFYDVKNGHFFSCPNSKGNILQKPPTFFFAIMEIPIWRTFYSMLTTDS